MMLKNKENTALIQVVYSKVLDYEMMLWDPGTQVPAGERHFTPDRKLMGLRILG